MTCSKGPQPDSEQGMLHLQDVHCNHLVTRENSVIHNINYLFSDVYFVKCEKITFEPLLSSFPTLSSRRHDTHFSDYCKI